MTVAKRPPTDFKLLRAISERHRDDYARSNSTKALVAIDIPQIADELSVDVNSVFGRLYYHLDPLYGQEKDAKGAQEVFFTPVAGSESNCVNFPLPEAVLASLWQQRRRDVWTIWIALGSLAIALGSLAVSIATATYRRSAGRHPLRATR